jgi:hypothetical protein
MMEVVKALLVSATVAILCSCSNPAKTGPHSGVSLLGKFASGALAKKAAGVTDSIDRVVALPLKDGTQFSIRGSFADRVEAPLAADGSFDLLLDSGVSGNWVVFLVNSQEADRTKKVKGILSLDFGSQTLQSLPIASASSGTVDVGTVNQSSTNAGETVTRDSAAANKQHFALSLSQLQTIAGNDDMVKALKNLYINVEASGLPPIILPRFSWGDSTTTPLDFTSVDQIMTTVPRYLLQFVTSDPAVTVDAVSNNTQGFELDAPAPVALLDPGFNVTQTTATIDGSFMASGCSVELNTSHIVFQTGYCQGPIPAGWWTLKRSGATMYSFDMGSAYSVDNTGKPKMIVPSMKLRVGADSVVTGVDVEWWGYDNGAYSRITDLSLVDNFFQSGLMIWLQPKIMGSVSDEYIHGFKPSQGSAVPVGGWSIAQGTLPFRLGMFSISGIANGVDYAFQWVLR